METQIRIQKWCTTLANKKGYEPYGSLIGNSNTGKLHSPGCRAIDMMKEDHKVPTNGAHFTPCKWCHPTGSGQVNNPHQYQLEDQEETEICQDPKINQLFQQAGCLSCGSKDGIVKMYPHENGVRLLGEEGHWWIYFECNCGYQTALWNVRQQKLIRIGI